MGARRGVTGYMVSHSGRFKFERRADRRGLTLLSASRPVFPSARERARVSGISPVNLSTSSRLNYILLLLLYYIYTRARCIHGRTSGREEEQTPLTKESRTERRKPRVRTLRATRGSRLRNAGDGLKVEIIILLLLCFIM